MEYIHNGIVFSHREKNFRKMGGNWKAFIMEGNPGSERQILYILSHMQILPSNCKICVLGAEEMAQWLRALAVLSGDLGSIPSTHIVTRL